MPVIRSSPSEVTSSLHSAERICGATSMTWQSQALRRSPAEALKRIAEFYAIEKDIRGRSAEERRLIRQQKSRPLADTFGGMAARQARFDQPEGQATRCRSLRAHALEGADALH